MSNATLWVRMGSQSPERMEPLVLLAAYASGILPDATMASQDRVKWFPVEVIIAFSVVYFERQGQGHLEIISDARKRLEQAGIRPDRAAGKVSGTVSISSGGASGSGRSKASSANPTGWKRLAWLVAAVVVAFLLIQRTVLQDSAPQAAQAKQNVQAPASPQNPADLTPTTDEPEDAPAQAVEPEDGQEPPERLKPALRLRRVREAIDAYRKQVDGEYPFSLKWLVSSELLGPEDLQGSHRELLYCRPPGGKQPTGRHVLVADLTGDTEGNSFVLMADGKLGRVPNSVLAKVLARQKRAAGN